MTTDDRLTLLARLGFAARGLVYCLVGGFAIAAARSGGDAGDNRSALASLADGGVGQVVLGIIALGLTGYAIWRLTAAAFDPEGHGHDAKGLTKRAGLATSGVVHLGLAFVAGRLALTGGGAGSGDAEAEGSSAWLMSQPGGVWLVGLAGIVLLGAAAGNFYESYKAKFSEHLGGDAPARSLVKAAGRIGYAARGVVFVLIGWFFIDSARRADPEKAGGTGQALETLRDQEFGPVLLGVVALGLLLFGIFGMIEARFRQLRVTTPL